MKKEEVKKILKRLEGICKFTQKLEEDYVKDEYMKALESISYQTVDAVIDRMVLNCVSELPTPPELFGMCKEHDKEQKANLTENQDFCYICMNNGFVVHKDSEHREYVLHCICEKGKEYTYDDSKLKHKSPFCTEPVTKYYDVDDLRAKNLFNKPERVEGWIL